MVRWWAAEISRYAVRLLGFEGKGGFPISVVQQGEAHSAAAHPNSRHSHMTSGDVWFELPPFTSMKS
jgi:hypothetical protein